jgi:hypothetical protein
MAANPYHGHGNPYGQVDAYGNVPTPMELSQEKLDEKARKWQQLQARVRSDTLRWLAQFVVYLP